MKMYYGFTLLVLLIICNVACKGYTNIDKFYKQAGYEEIESGVLSKDIVSVTDGKHIVSYVDVIYPTLNYISVQKVRVKCEHEDYLTNLDIKNCNCGDELSSLMEQLLLRTNKYHIKFTNFVVVFKIIICFMSLLSLIIFFISNKIPKKFIYFIMLIQIICLSLCLLILYLP